MQRILVTMRMRPEVAEWLEQRKSDLRLKSKGSVVEYLVKDRDPATFEWLEPGEYGNSPEEKENE